VVVAVGLTLVVPVADVDVKVPGVMAILVAPVTIQLSVLLAPEVMLVGSAVNEAIVGAGTFTVGGAITPQPASPTQIKTTMSRCAQPSSPEGLSPQCHVPALPLTMFVAP
jgi:hypothetical protein